MKIETRHPVDRNGLEITDVNEYFYRGKMIAYLVKSQDRISILRTHEYILKDHTRDIEFIMNTLPNYKN